jgi:D-sedoheptulose 7-phosphate isomerase
MIGVELGSVPYLQRLQNELARIDHGALNSAAEMLFEAWSSERFVFLCGNGGSAALASHLAEDLGKGSLRNADLQDETKRRLKVMSLTDNGPWLTAIGNDLGYDQVFVQQLMHYGSRGDLLIAISGSGNSPNVLAAVDWANQHGLRTFGFTGFSGGRLRAIQQAGFHVPLDDMGMVESVHTCVSHWLVDDLYARMQREGRYATVPQDELKRVSL